MIDEKYISYPKKVLSGEIIAGEYIKLACQRYLDWFSREDLEFKTKKADKVVNFCNNVSNGKNKNLKIDLQEWQKFILYAVFGWYYKGTKERVIHTVFVEVARKNGKSTFISLIALYMMMADGEYKSEVDILANSHKQAQLLYNMSSDFCESIDPQGKYFKRYRDNIQFPKTKSMIQVLSSDTTALDGYNAYMFVQDEVHEAPNDLLYNVMKTSQASRVNPLAILITTAGLNMDSFCYHFRSNCIEVLHGLKQDDSLFSMIYSLDENDDYRDSEVWVKANPNLGVSVKESYLKEQVISAQNNTTLTSNIQTKNFNIWSQTFDVWIENNLLLKASKPIDWVFYKDKVCYLGVDLAAVSDLTAVSFLTVYDDVYYFKTLYYIPSSCLSHNYNQEKYRKWRNTKDIRVITGNCTDYDVILSDILKLRENGALIESVAYDSWNATQFAINATAEGLPLSPFSQTLGNFNRPTKEMERLLKNGKVVFDDNEITRWCYQNATLKVDWNENAKPVKMNNDNYKIDGVISSIQALGSFLSSPRYTAII